jgi:hypothetical protein
MVMCQQSSFKFEMSALAQVQNKNSERMHDVKQTTQSIPLTLMIILKTRSMRLAVLMDQNIPQAHTPTLHLNGRAAVVPFTFGLFGWERGLARGTPSAVSGCRCQTEQIRSTDGLELITPNDQPYLYCTYGSPSISQALGSSYLDGTNHDGISKEVQALLRCIIRARE